MANLLKNAKKLPIINWNYTFFGAHSQQVTKGWLYPRERHAAFEMIYVLSGVEEIDCEPYAYYLEPGDFAIISPGTYHEVSAQEDLDYFCFHFDLDEPVFEEHLIQSTKLVYHVGDPTTTAVTSKMDDMMAIVSKKNEDYTFEDKMSIQLLLSQILLTLFKDSHEHTATESVSTMEYAKIIRVNIKQTVNRRINQAISDTDTVENTDIIADICAHLHLSVSYASHLFKTFYGTSPKAYLSGIKQEAAQKLLLKPQFSIAQISAILGYQTPGNFSRQFKRWTGYSPKQYRLQKVSHFVDQRLFSENFSTFDKQQLLSDPEFKEHYWSQV